MPLDPQAQNVMDVVAALGLPPNHLVSPAEARVNMLARPRAPGPEVAKVEDASIPNGDFEVPVRIYTPPGTGPFPVLSWIHGGGWVIGNLETADATARHLCVKAECVVVSVDYRLAPEHKFPVPFEDCYAATSWVQRNAASLNADPARVAVGGDSAGGNLSAAVSIAARDRGGLPIVFQLLVYPVTARDYNTASYVQNAEGYLLSADAMRWYWDHYLANDEDATIPYAAPLAASDLSGLPPALVITAEFDPLRDEGEAYAAKLQEAGVQAKATRYDGMIHGFFGMSGAVDKADVALAEAAEALKKSFSAAETAATR